MDDDGLLPQRSFLRVIETGSLSAAAKALQTDVSTVSRRLAALEKRLGQKLVERGLRRSEPTEAGLRYFEGLRRLIDQQDALEAELRQEAETPRGLLRVAAPVSLGERHVAGWLHEFQSGYPRVAVELLLDDRFVDLRAAGVDVALRIGQLADSALTARRMGVMQLGLYASTDYLARRGRPEQPSDLDSHDFVLFSFLEAGDHLRLRHDDGRAAEVRMGSRFGVNSIDAILRVIAAGGGIHAGPLWRFEPAREAGEIERVLPGWQPPLYPLHALHGFGRRQPAKVSRWLDFLAVRVAELKGLV
ncbi:hypothetical protein IP84_02345 [beta proteobacterium AAP99]|nr:hypothetical protein IP84_02345 [beta proteobacterium AAP99]